MNFRCTIAEQGIIIQKKEKEKKRPPAIRPLCEKLTSPQGPEVYFT